eukprot:4991008-Prymnesium_polylepis.1
MDQKKSKEGSEAVYVYPVHCAKVHLCNCIAHRALRNRDTYRITKMHTDRHAHSQSNSRSQHVAGRVTNKSMHDQHQHHPSSAGTPDHGL